MPAALCPACGRGNSAPEEQGEAALTRPSLPRQRKRVRVTQAAARVRTKGEQPRLPRNQSLRRVTRAEPRQHSQRVPGRVTPETQGRAWGVGGPVWGFPSWAGGPEDPKPLALAGIGVVSSGGDRAPPAVLGS